jgi:methylmalonyl-CoA/ethylmalonyl-CoA epimerase
MLELHHIGNLVDSIDISLKEYSIIYGECCLSKIHFISTQDVKVCFVKTGQNIFIELVEPSPFNLALQRLRKKGFGLYHLGYMSTTFEEDIEELKAYGYKPLQEFRSEAFNNNRCLFLFSPTGEFVEIIEKTAF